MEKRLETAITVRRERAVARAWADLRRVVPSWRFGIPAALLTAWFTGYGATLPPDTPLRERVIVAVAGSLGGALVLGLLAFVVLVATAPVRQRDEAWKALGIAEHIDLGMFSAEFSVFIDRVRAARPKPAFRFGNMFQMDRGEQSRVKAADARADDEARREALRQYHERFATRVLRVIEDAPSEFVKAHKNRANAPEGFQDLFRLHAALERLAAGTGSVLAERQLKAEELQATIGEPHISNSLSDYDWWRTETHTILIEQNDTWANAFAERREGTPGRTWPQATKDLRRWLDEDIARLREFASEVHRS